MLLLAAAALVCLARAAMLLARRLAQRALMAALMAALAALAARNQILAVLAVVDRPLLVLLVIRAARQFLAQVAARLAPGKRRLLLLEAQAVNRAWRNWMERRVALEHQAVNLLSLVLQAVARR